VSRKSQDDQIILNTVIKINKLLVERKKSAGLASKYLLAYLVGSTTPQIVPVPLELRAEGSVPLANLLRAH